MVQNEQVRCWFEDFLAFLEDEGESFPVEDRFEFKKLLELWSQTNAGVVAQSNLEVGFVQGNLKYFKVTADSIGKSMAPNYIMKPIIK